MAGIPGRGQGRPHHGGALPADLSATSGVAAAARAAAEGGGPEDTVPQEVKQKLIALLKERGAPIQQAQLPSAWNEAYPGVPLAYKEWGFDRLKDALLEIPDAIRLEKDPSGRDFLVSLAGQSGGTTASADGDKIERQKHVLLSGQKYAFTIDCLARDFAASLPGGLGPTQDARKGGRHHHAKMQRENSQVSV